jgi:hypothetical protein
VCTTASTNISFAFTKVSLSLFLSLFVSSSTFIAVIVTSVSEERGEKREKKARKDNINEISLDNSDEDDSTSSGDNIITTGGDIEKSPDPHEIVMLLFSYLFITQINICVLYR